MNNVYFTQRQIFNTFSLMDPYLLGKWLSLRAIRIGKECGEFCDHWIDYDHLQSIERFEDRQAYREKCFLPSLRLSAADGKVKIFISCQSCHFVAFSHTIHSRPELFCKKQFPVLEKLLEEEFNKFLRPRNEGK